VATTDTDSAQQTAAERMTAAGRYEQLATTRLVFLQRARHVSKLTIPGLMPPEGHTGASELYKPYQSIGADGVNNLSAKLLLALFPPGTGFFRLTMDDFTVEQLKAKAVQANQDPEDARAKFEDALSKVERAVVNRMEQKGCRTVNFETLQHLVVTGNALVESKADGGEKFYPLDHYVVKRDLDGHVLEIIAKESLARSACPPRVQAVLNSLPSSPEQDKEKNVDLYTWIKRADDGSWTVHQEVEGSIIPGTEGTYPEDKCAWLALRWRAVPNEDYGRGRGEEYLGDLVSAEALSKAIIEFAAQAAKVNWFVDESGTTDKEQVAHAPNGAVLSGNAKDISVLMLEKGQDFTVAKQTLDDVKHRLERAFLNASAIQRNAERVTAEEIRAMIGELEQGLGGVYAILGEEFQRPLAARVLHQMMKSGAIPQLPKDIVSPQIVTGLDGLSRQSDAQKLDALLEGVSQMFGPPAVAQYIDIGAYITRRGAAIGIDTSGIVKSSTQVAQEAQQQQQSEMAQKLGPSAIKVAGDAARQAQTAPAGAAQGDTNTSPQQ